MRTYEHDTHQSPSQECFKKVALRIGRSWSLWSVHETRVETERLLMASYSRTVQSDTMQHSMYQMDTIRFLTCDEIDHCDVCDLASRLTSCTAETNQLTTEARQPPVTVCRP